MKFVSWNVNGIRACVKKGFVDVFQELDADVFCIQESKLQAGQLDLDMPGYHQYWNYAVKKGYSGTAIFTKKEPLSVSYGIGIEEHDQEGRVITLEFEDYYFITVYTPNSQSELARLDYRMKWEEDFLAYLKKLEETKPVVFCGDLNVAHREIDLKNPKTNRKNAGFTDEERGKFGELLEAGFIDTFRYFYPDAIGYLGLGVFPTLLEAAGLVSYGATTRFNGLPDSSSRWIIVPILFILMIGGSFIKSIISASVAKETTEATRARGYSIFYMMVNVGAFTGKTIIDPLRNVIGEQAYIYINYFSGAMTVIALLAVILLYKSTHTAGEGKSLREIGQGFMRIMTNWRLLILILIVTGFWMVQQQLYATMPKYVIRLAGETAKPGWIANVNPFVVVCCVSFITRLMAKRSAITSMNVGMFLIPVSALLMACGNILGNDIISGMSNITLMMVAGIVVQALAECFISPRYLEYFSLQAPKGEEGMYLGFSHLHSFLSSIFGFGLAGILLTKYCPDPALFETRAAWEAASANAHYIWYYFAAIGLIAAIALLLFAKITESIDKKKKSSR